LAQTGGSFESCYDCIFVVSLRAWIVNCYVNEDSFKLLYQIVFLVFIFCFSFLSGCNLSDLWIPEAMEDLLSVMPIFHGSTDVSYVFHVFIFECNLSDLWIPEAMEDLLPSMVFLLVWIVVNPLISGFLRR
jgi:hypothetical protein